MALKSFLTPAFLIERNKDRCIQCKVCVNQCANKVHFYDEEEGEMLVNEMDCVNCQRCVTLCPTRALTIRKSPNEFRANANWTSEAIRSIYIQAETGGVC